MPAVVGQRTSLAQPNFSNSQISRAEMSICPRSTPCRAQVGSAWCRLCQASPMLRMASGQKLRDLSRLANGRLPIMWQIELIDHVTWCSTPIRTRLPQKKPVTAPHQDQVTRPPMIAGNARLATTSQAKLLLTHMIARSASRSGTKRRSLVSPLTNSQPKCACTKPLTTATGEVPNSHGECGSPSLSE